MPPKLTRSTSDFHSSYLFDNHRNMESIDAANALGSLAQVMLFLAKHSCAGSEELCAPLAHQLAYY